MRRAQSPSAPCKNVLLHCCHRRGELTEPSLSFALQLLVRIFGSQLTACPWLQQPIRSSCVFSYKAVNHGSDRAIPPWIAQAQPNSDDTTYGGRV